MCDGRMHRRTDRWTYGLMYRLIDRRSEEKSWVDEQMDRRTDGMMDEGKHADFVQAKKVSFSSDFGLLPLTLICMLYLKETR